MKTVPRFSVFALILLVVNCGFAQQYNITGAGARAEGFGGAFIGVADDATAVVWNPAGLSQLQRPEASVVTKYVMEKSDYSYTPNPTFNESTSLSHVVFNFGSLAIPLKLGGMNLVLAAAYQRQLDFYDSYNQTDYSYEEKGGVDTFTPGLGLQIGPVFSLGFATNIWFGKDQYDKKLQFPSTSDPNLSYDGSPSGLNFVGGAMVDFGGLKSPFPLKIGASVRTPFTLTTDYSFRWSPDLLGVLPDAKVTSKAEMPLMIGVGASYRIGENLTVAVDYETRAYGDKNIIRDYTTSIVNFSDTVQMSDSKKDLNQIRVGAEYLIVTDAGVFPIRAGYQSVPTLLAYYDANNQASGQVVGDGFSVGTGFISGSFALDFTFVRVSYTAGGAFNKSSTAYTRSTIAGSLILYF